MNTYEFQFNVQRPGKKILNYTGHTLAETAQEARQKIRATLEGMYGAESEMEELSFNIYPASLFNEIKNNRFK